jgi:hypothetical protein
MSNRLFWVHFHENIIESLVLTTFGGKRFLKFLFLYGRVLPNGNISIFYCLELLDNTMQLVVQHIAAL